MERAVGAPARFSRLLRVKASGFTALFETDGAAVVLKAVTPPPSPAAHLAYGAAHRAAPAAVPELLAWEDRGGAHWYLVPYIEGVPARVGGADAVLAVADIVAGIQADLVGRLPDGLPVVSGGPELDGLVPLSLHHVDLRLDNALRTPDGGFVVLGWEEAVVSCPLFSLERLRPDAVDHGVAALAERAYLQRLLPSLDETDRRRAVALAAPVAPPAPHDRAAPPVQVTVRERGAGDVCRAVLDTLPHWFGMPEANDEYVSAADAGRTLVAELDGEAVGLLVPLRHSDAAAEIHLLAVAAPHRRRGIGRVLVEEAERLLAADGVAVLQVKTLSARRHDAGYEETRAFYRSVGFVHLEEHPALWGPDNPALQMVKPIRPAR